MWYSPPKYYKPLTDVNSQFKLLEGELDDYQAKLTLAQFLHRNLKFTVHLLSGVSLYPDQVITLRGMLTRNYSLNIWSRGGGKSFLTAVYCILQAIFYPNSQILLAGPTFRTARFVFNYIEKMVSNKNGKMLMDAMGEPSRRADEFRWRIGTSEIIAIPLSGERIRGFRANVLVVDELLLMTEEIVEKVLMPFLAVPPDMALRKKVRDEEDDKIRQGKMTEAERRIFTNKSKFIGLSSASYTCEYLYKKYEEYIKKIYDPVPDLKGNTYFISQIGYDGFKNYQDRLEEGITSAAKTEANSANFRREYGAQFVDGSDSYFSMEKMNKQTIADGEQPTLLLRGSKEKKYILSFDPSGSNSTRGDDFAMCVIELDDDLKGGTVIHTYAEAGKDLKDHIKYFHYLLTNFNIVMICGDHAGHHPFIDSANESEAFKRSGLELRIIDFDSTKDGTELYEELKNAKRMYNLEAKRIVFTVLFREDSIRKMNEHLQGCIDFKKIWFGSSIKGDGAAFSKATGSGIDPKALGYKDILDMVDDQDVLIKQMKYQCATIEVKTTAKGSTTFDLPQLFKRDTGPGRLRKDAYTSLLLGCWGMKTYEAMINLPVESFSDSFTPFFAA